MSRPQPAKTVVYRHPCDCASASRPLADDEKPEHRFDVDGEPFPWLLPGDDQPGPRFTRLLDDLWRIDLTILPIDRDPSVARDVKVGRIPGPTDEVFSDQFTTGWGPTIFGRSFPWTLTGDGVTYQHDHKHLPNVTLAFYSEAVDTDTEVDDQRHIDQTIVDNDGSMWHQSRDDAALEAKMHEATKDWPSTVYDADLKVTAVVDPVTGDRLPYDRGWSWTEAPDGSRVCRHPDGTELVVSL